MRRFLFFWEIFRLFSFVLGLVPRGAFFFLVGSSLLVAFVVAPSFYLLRRSCIMLYCFYKVASGGDGFACGRVLLARPKTA